MYKLRALLLIGAFWLLSLNTMMAVTNPTDGKPEETEQTTQVSQEDLMCGKNAADEPSDKKPETDCPVEAIEIKLESGYGWALIFEMDNATEGIAFQPLND